jgi:hypothetical protein
MQVRKIIVENWIQENCNEAEEWFKDALQELVEGIQLEM